MDLKKAKILLEKIASLHKSMSSDPTNISAIERDLMMNYVRQLYEAYLHDGPAAKAAEVEAPSVEIIKTTRKAPKKTVVKKAPPVLEVPQIEEEEVVEIVTPKPKYKPPRVIDLPDSLKEITEPIPAPKPKSTPTPKPTPRKEAASVSPDLEELFEVKEAKELSEKLSALPIKDLKKAMGLNEKIFTINELFGGDQAAYDAAIATLNGVNDFTHAKAYLIENVAGKYGWTNKGKKKKAANFIKLVSRRYS